MECISVTMGVMEKEQKKGGRPFTGRDYGQQKSVRFSADDRAVLEQLVKLWRCSEAAAVRRAVWIAAEKEGVKP